MNVIERWLKTEITAAHRIDADAKLQAIIDHLKGVPIADWVRPRVARMAGPEWNEIWEIRFKVRKVQYRPLLYLGPRQGEATLLMGATERDDRIVPANAPDICTEHKTLTLEARRHVIEH